MVFLSIFLQCGNKKYTKINTTDILQMLNTFENNKKTENFWSVFGNRSKIVMDDIFNIPDIKDAIEINYGIADFDDMIENNVVRNISLFSDEIIEGPFSPE